MLNISDIERICEFSLVTEQIAVAVTNVLNRLIMIR